MKLVSVSEAFCYDDYMKEKNVFIITTILVVCVVGIVAGFFIPISEYTTVNGCPSDQTPVKRLHLVAGQSIESIKQLDKLPTDPAVGCSVNTRYILYLL